jgi:regulator of cell morphogenesis and NO signaling
MSVRAGRLVGEVAATVPEAIDGFRAAAIDCCRDAQFTLEEASLRSGVRLGRLIALTLGGRRRDRTLPDWREAPLRALTRHIVLTVHPSLIAAMERTSAAVADFAQSHPNAWAIGGIRSAFAEVANNLVIHVWRVENEVFPLLDRLEGAQGASAPRLTSEDFPDPHDPMLEGLRRLRSLTQSYVAPPNLPDLEPLLADMRRFDHALHHHIHLEHHVLYPRASALCASPLTGSEPAPSLRWI